MNAPAVRTRGVQPVLEASPPGPLDIVLFRAAMRGEAGLSDFEGCEAVAAHELGRRASLNEVSAARRRATDHVQRFAREAAAAISAALICAKRVAERGIGAEAHAALAETSDLIACALAGVRT